MAEREVSVAVLGAAGTIAPAIITDLGESAEVASMALLDLDAAKAQAVARAHGSGKASAAAIDARDVDALASAVEGADVLVNTASYRINLEAMRACLQAGCHYLDLGGLYWMTDRQLELGPDFEQAGRLAVLGIGSSPGKTNLMAAEAVGRLGPAAARGVESIDVFAAGRDRAAPDDGRLRPPYAIQTLLDELTLEPVVIRDGHADQIAPLTAGGAVDYGEPIGIAETIYTLHSELATFGESFGCRSASFRLSLAPALLARLKELVGAPPEEVAAAARGAASPSNQTVSVHLVRVSTTDGRATTVRAVTRPHFGLGGSVVSTAAPAAACVRLFARGALTAAGAHPPERCIDPLLMFAELEARGCAFSFTS
ncbi:MAG: saccharopine dehydrogenase NADP-binding domain-containing protein [Solirubrobacterales bacterium]|nr:saccharopine dehydrogenase NADP-binding domain-containing protein [Solirubrobacterales bacterium]